MVNMLLSQMFFFILNWSVLCSLQSKVILSCPLTDYLGQFFSAELNTVKMVLNSNKQVKVTFLCFQILDTCCWDTSLRGQLVLHMVRKLRVWSHNCVIVISKCELHVQVVCVRIHLFTWQISSWRGSCCCRCCWCWCCWEQSTEYSIKLYFFATGNRTCEIRK